MWQRGDRNSKWDLICWLAVALLWRAQPLQQPHIWTFKRMYFHSGDKFLNFTTDLAPPWCGEPTWVTLALQTHAKPTIWQLFRLGVLSVLCHPGVALIVQFQKVPPAIQSRWSNSLNRKYGITIQQKVWDYTFNKRLASFRLWVPTWLCQCTSIMLEAYIGWLILLFRPKDFSF